MHFLIFIIPLHFYIVIQITISIPTKNVLKISYFQCISQLRLNLIATVTRFLFFKINTVRDLERQF